MLLARLALTIPTHCPVELSGQARRLPAPFARTTPRRRSDCAAVMLSKLEPHRVRAGLDVFVIPDFAQNKLGFDPAALQQSLEANYPVRGSDAKIQPDTVQPFSTS